MSVPGTSWPIAGMESEQEELLAYHYCWPLHTTYSDFWMCLRLSLKARLNNEYSPCHTCPDFYHRLNLVDKWPIVKEYLGRKQLQLDRAHNAHEFIRVSPSEQEVRL